VNGNIPNGDVRIIDVDGNQLGVFGKQAALALANAKGLDIVVVSPDAKPMIAKLMDYSKHKYEQKKKQKEAKKNQHIPDLKEVQLSPVIQQHDIETKLNNARKFINNGDRVKVVMRLKGRMISHSDIGKKVMEDFFTALEDIAVMEKKLQLDDKFFNMTLIKKK
jgi:translation initiation factor IF-3